MNLTQGSALDVQIGGGHYKECKIQPVEYIYANQIGYFEGNVIKYVTRWKTKNGLDDLRKARHYLDLLIEMEGKQPKKAAKTQSFKPEIEVERQFPSAYPHSAQMGQIHGGQYYDPT